MFKKCMVAVCLLLCTVGLIPIAGCSSQATIAMENAAIKKVKESGVYYEQFAFGSLIDLCTDKARWSASTRMKRVTVSVSFYFKNDKKPHSVSINAESLRILFFDGDSDYGNQMYQFMQYLINEMNERNIFPEPAKGYFLIRYENSYNGYVNGSQRQYVKEGEYTETVYASPEWGYRFDRWSDGNTSQSRSDKASESFSVYPIFVANNYTLLYSAGEGGYLVGDTYQSVYSGDYGTEVTAVPYSGYVFDRWSDGSSFPTRSDYAYSDDNYTAYFRSEY